MNEETAPLAEMLEQQRRKAELVGVPQIRRHIFLCCDQTKPNCSAKEQSLAAWDFLKARLDELGLTGAGGIYRTKANCLRICKGGPVAVVYPEGAGTRIAIRPCWKRSSKSTSSAGGLSRSI